jgi:hypothetical protein
VLTMLRLFSDDLSRQIKHGAAAIAVATAVLVPGAIWYKASIMTISRSSAQEQAAMLRGRIQTLRQQLTTESLLAEPEMWQKNSSRISRKLRRDLPFDLVVVMDSERRLVDGFRALSGVSTPADLSQESFQRLVPADSGFFDQVSVKASASGLIEIEGRPMLIAVRKTHIVSTTSFSEFVVIGQWLDVRRLASNGEQAEQKIELYSLSEGSQLPPDVRAAVSPAQNGHGFTFVLDRRGNGVIDGHVFALIDDITSRPAMIARLPWTVGWGRAGRLGFALYFVAAAIAGIGTWGLLFRADRKNRNRKRRFDGLDSLKEEHIATLVECFPGYAFAVNTKLQYVGVSRILAGVTAQEPSFFRGQEYGSMAHEWNPDDLDLIFTNLRDPNRWPRVAIMDHVVEGLGERHVFHGAAHYLGKHDILLVILSQKENPVVIASTGSQVVSIADAKAGKKSIKNSEVA